VITIYKKQLRKNDCGISAALNLLACHDQKIDRKTVEKNIKIDSEGVRFSDLKITLKTLGYHPIFNILDTKCNSELLNTLQPSVPCIVQVANSSNNHYLVIKSISDDGIVDYIDSKVGCSSKKNIEDLKDIILKKTSSIKFEDIKENLLKKIHETLKKHQIIITLDDSPKEIVETYTKISFFKEIYKNIEKGKRKKYLESIIKNNIDDYVPKKFQNIVYKEKLNTVSLLHSICLSIKFDTEEKTNPKNEKLKMQ